MMPGGYNRPLHPASMACLAASDVLCSPFESLSLSIASAIARLIARRRIPPSNSPVPLGRPRRFAGVFRFAMLTSIIAENIYLAKIIPNIFLDRPISLGKIILVVAGSVPVTKTSRPGCEDQSQPGLGIRC